MTSRAGFLYDCFLRRFPYEPTPCQDTLLQAVAAFLTADDGDILVVNGYAGTGKTTAVASVVGALKDLEINSVLLAPTGRSAKVLSQYAAQSASTIHKHIYRQKSIGTDGFGQFCSGADCRLILIGDAAQLPPVGLDASPALSPAFMDGFGGVQYVTMTTVVRQGADSGILLNATHLRSMLPYGGEELGLTVSPDVERITGGELLETLSDAYSRYGEDDVVVLCRSNKRAGRYNAGIRASVLFHEENLVRGERLMIVKNHYLEGLEGTDYIANGDMAKLVWIRHFEERYGLHFADACLSLPDYGDQEVEMKVLLDTLESDAPSLPYEQSQALYQGVSADYAHLTTKKKRYQAVREDPFFNALQIKYAHAITCHKAQGGQWRCVFIDNPLWQDVLQDEDIKWLYTALTRAIEKVYLVNFREAAFNK